jgi:hypothetical protein
VNTQPVAAATPRRAPDLVHELRVHRMAAERGQPHGQGDIVAVGGAQGRVAEHQLGLLPRRFVDQLDAPAAGRNRRTQLQRVDGRRRRVGEPLEGAAQRRRDRVGLDVAREREDQVAAAEVTAEVGGDLGGAGRLQHRLEPVGRVAVRVVGVEVVDEEAAAQLAVVVAGLVDLRRDLLAGSLQLAGG